MDVTNWLTTPNICMEYLENYGKHMLMGPDGKCAEFRLMPKYLCNGYGEECIVQFNLTFSQGRMLPNWEELLFTPLGCEAVPELPAKLPPWTPSQDPVYSKVLDSLITQLYAADCDIERLEANLPVFLDHSPDSKRKLTIDRVRMVYLENVVDGPNPNLVLIVFSYLDGYKVMQNGAGTGPPR